MVKLGIGSTTAQSSVTLLPTLFAEYAETQDTWREIAQIGNAGPIGGMMHQDRCQAVGLLDALVAAMLLIENTR